MFLFTAFWHYIAYPWHYRQCSLCGITVQSKALHAIVMRSIALCIVCVCPCPQGWTNKSQNETKERNKGLPCGFSALF